MHKQTKNNTKELTTNSKTSRSLNPIIQAQSNVKAYQYGPEELSEMARVLNKIVFTMAFDRKPTPEVLLVLANWIKEHFGGLSMQEVALAFDLVTAKKIGSDIRHYNMFSKQYVGEVLNAYQIHRNAQIKAHNEAEAIKRLEQPSQGATDQQMYDGIKKIAVEKGEIMKVADWTAAYRHAWKYRLIKRMNDKQREEYKQGVIEAMKTEKRAGFDVSFGENSIQTECHRRIIQAHFQEMINQ